MRILITFAIIICSFSLFGQDATLKGSIYDELERTPIQGATITVDGLDAYSISDSLGQWKINLSPGLYNIYISHINYEKVLIFEQRVYRVRENFIEQAMTPISEIIDITISSTKLNRSAVNGNNIKTLEIDEIQRMPGAVMDMSKVIRNFPGVSPRVSFGYNIIVRGGGSFENTFYLDEIEIPAITHFSVQGLSGGPNGLINTDLIERATFRTGTFQANRGNTLSSVMDMEQKAGRRDRIGTKLTLGAAEYGIHVEGPLGKHSSYIFSARKSYTEFLLKAFDLPVLPAFTDFQYKHKVWLPNNDLITIVGLGARDRYFLNTEAEASDALLYNIGFIPEGTQNTNVLGLNYKHFTEKGFYTFVVSTNRFKNNADKFYDNTGLEEDRSLRFRSNDNEVKFRLENKVFNKHSQFQYGINVDLIDFDLDQYAIFASRSGTVDTLNFTSELNYQEYGFFLDYNVSLAKRWNLYAGVRMDANNIGEKMMNPFSQFSPRASLQYIISPKISTTLTSGIYYQNVPNILLAYKQDDQLININELEYIQSSQISWGIDYEINDASRFNFDVFYKNYDQYPFLLRDSISFANANGEYVSVGNQAANSSSQGRAYGAEIYYQQKLRNNWFYNCSASYIVSEFKDVDESFISSAWDNRTALNVILGKTFGKNWSIGGKFTYAGGNPYTAFDENLSSNIELWDANRRGIFDYDNINSSKLPAYHALDFRIDKKWFLKKSTIIAFLDLQNLYNNNFQLIPYLAPIYTEDGELQVNQTDPSRYDLQTINSDTGRVLPTIGFSIEF